MQVLECSADMSWRTLSQTAKAQAVATWIDMHCSLPSALDIILRLLASDFILAHMLSAHLCSLAGGCFWGLELAYQRMPGVSQTSVGYTAGNTKNPTYQQVCSGRTGHAEAVQVRVLLREDAAPTKCWQPCHKPACLFPNHQHGRRMLHTTQWPTPCWTLRNIATHCARLLCGVVQVAHAVEDFTFIYHLRLDVDLWCLPTGVLQPEGGQLRAAAGELLRQGRPHDQGPPGK